MAAAAVDAVVEEEVVDAAVDAAVVVEAVEVVALSLAEAVALALDTDFSHTIVVLAP
jgi:hypothetical protein